MTDTLRMLPVKLDALEREQRAKELAELLHDIERSELAEQERRRAAKDKAETMKARASDLARIVRNGSEERPTLVTQHDNTTRWTIDLVRLDTGECYESRPMTASEREKAAQLALWGGAVESGPKKEPEPGRNDPLPEAGDAPRPKRQGKTRTKADALVNEAAEQSDGWGL